MPKGRGTSKGKAPAKKRVVPQLSHSSSSSDEEAWPIWQELQEKMAVLEAQRLAPRAQQSELPRRSARDTKGSKKSKLKALANDLMERFNVLEAAQVSLAETQQVLDGSAAASKVSHRRSSTGQETTEAVETAAAVREEREVMEEAGTSLLAGSTVPGNVAGVYGEAAGLYTPHGSPAIWPWAGGHQLQHTPCTACSVGHSGGQGTHGHQASVTPSGWGLHCQTTPTLGAYTASACSGVLHHPSVPNTGYNTVPYAALPYGDYSTPLGDHLTPAMKDKIWRGEFVEVFDLLNRENDSKNVDKEDEKEKERRRRKKPERTWANWVPGFIIYAGVVVKAQPWRALSLLQYFDIIYRAYTDFAGQAWLMYDQAFRMRSAIQPNLRWDEPQPGLWLQHMAPARPNIGERFDSGHLIRKLAVSATTRTGAGQTVQPRLPCFDFNFKGTCSRNPCKFSHECINCGGRHPKVNCFKTGFQRQAKGNGTGKKPGGSGGTAGKGTHTN